MAGSLNKATLIGSLGKDPESRSFQNGGKVVNFSVATSESWKDKSSGEKKERVEWHKIVVHNEHLVNFAETYLRKGTKVYIEGQIETRKYEKEGRDIYTTEIVLRPYNGVITMLSSPKEKSTARQETVKDDPSAPAVYNPENDEIPF